MKITLASDFYTHSAIEKITNQFSEYIIVNWIFDNEIHLDLQIKDEFSPQSKKIINSFLNNILDLSIQEKFKNGY